MGNKLRRKIRTLKKTLFLNNWEDYISPTQNYAFYFERVNLEVG
jgi:hypothetical protein